MTDSVWFIYNQQLNDADSLYIKLNRKITLWRVFASDPETSQTTIIIETNNIEWVGKYLRAKKIPNGDPRRIIIKSGRLIDGQFLGWARRRKNVSITKLWVQEPEQKRRQFKTLRGILKKAFPGIVH